MKRLLPALTLLLIFLGACSPSVVSTPAVDVIRTSVAQTLTALPSQIPAVILATPAGNTPTTSLPTITTQAPIPTTIVPAAPTMVIIPPTPIRYPTAIIYPTPLPLWSPTYVDQFIYYYFQRINARDYSTSWSLLTDSFKAAVNSEVSGGYSGYTAYWNTVQRVDILNVIVTSWNVNYATVAVNMVYNYLDGHVNSSNQTFHLFYDTWRGSWMFDAAASAPPTAIPPVIPTSIPTAIPVLSYPADFIYYYFNNINLRNYTLTWSLLSPSFIANNNPPAEGGYTGYVNYWNSVSRVDVTYITVNSNSGGYAEVAVGLVYNYGTGLVTTGNPHYHLVYNLGLGNWQFYSP
jgi:hypothetical protein